MNFHLLGGRRQKGIVREFGKVMYTLLYLKMDNHQEPTCGIWCVCVCTLCVCPTLSVLIDCSLPAPLSLEFSRQENWSKKKKILKQVALSFSGDFPSAEIKPTTLLSVMWLPVRSGVWGGWIHVCTRLSPLAVHLKLSQHCLLISSTQ